MGASPPPRKLRESSPNTRVDGVNGRGTYSLFRPAILFTKQAAGARRSELLRREGIADVREQSDGAKSPRSSLRPGLRPA
jgi:hypothetical protein